MPSISQFLTLLLRGSPYTFLPVHKKGCLWPSIWYGQSQPHQVYFVMKCPGYLLFLSVVIPNVRLFGRRNYKCNCSALSGGQGCDPSYWELEEDQSYLNRLLMLYNSAFEISLTKVYGQDNSSVLPPGIKFGDNLVSQSSKVAGFVYF